MVSRGVVLQEEPVDAQLAEQRLGAEVIAALGCPRGAEVAALLEPIDKADYVFVNHARWDSSLPRVMLEQFLKPTFWTYVLANLRANRVGAMPSLYRLA